MSNRTLDLVGSWSFGQEPIESEVLVEASKVSSEAKVEEIISEIEINKVALGVEVDETASRAESPEVALTPGATLVLEAPIRSRGVELADSSLKSLVLGSMNWT